ncbi:hypothetical protein [Candidatus Poriferisodalis sp.]|uniref:hypothetical protein n=1 Tax=Candidatus Poriferisodalis sp. TaxID=3101277 RepID=UPI003AF776A8
MATYEAYRGLTLPEAVLELVEQDGNERTRHLSRSVPQRSVDRRFSVVLSPRHDARERAPSAAPGDET